jgi:hypothetical protein
MKSRACKSRRKAAAKGNTPFFKSSSEGFFGKTYQSAISGNMQAGGARLHTDAHAASMAENINAKAFTVGQDIFFNKNEYQPATEKGRRIIAHELAHAFQNRQVIARTPDEEAEAAEKKNKEAEIVKLKAAGFSTVEDGNEIFKSGELALANQAVAKIPKEDKDAIKGAILKRVTSLGGKTAGMYSNDQGYDDTSIQDKQMIELSNKCFDAKMTTDESIRLIIHEIGHAVASKPFVVANRELIKQGLKTNQSIKSFNDANDEFNLANDANTAAVDVYNAAVEVNNEAIRNKDTAAIPAANADMKAKKAEWDKAAAERAAKEKVYKAKEKEKDTQKANLATKEVAAKAKQADITDLEKDAGSQHANLLSSFSSSKQALDKTDAAGAAYANAVTQAQAAIVKFYDENVTIQVEESAADAAKNVVDSAIQERDKQRSALTTANKDHPLLAATTAVTATQDQSFKAATVVAFNRGINLSVRKFYDLVIKNGISPNLTTYAAENWPHKPEEFYAEAYSYFITRPTNLEAHSKLLYDWFKAGSYR